MTELMIVFYTMFAVTMLCLLHVMALPLPNDDDDMIEW
jgi:hypothetical protein